MLRHGARLVAASAIGTQYYCEMKVEQQLIHGDIETESKLEGRRLHEEIIKSRKVGFDELSSKIRTEPAFLATLPLATEYKGVYVGGVPDAILFGQGQPYFLIELKTTSGNPRKLWRDELVQAKAYGLCLDLLGFDCSELDLVVVRLSREIARELDGTKKRELLGLAIVALPKDEERAKFEKKFKAWIYDFNYDRADATKDIDWALDYWTNQRNPIATKKLSKCRACEFKAACPSSLVW